MIFFAKIRHKTQYYKLRLSAGLSRSQIEFVLLEQAKKSSSKTALFILTLDNIFDCRWATATFSWD